MHVSYSTAPWNDDGHGWRSALVTIGEGDTAWQPGSTKHIIYGPALLLYRQAPDGGVDVEVTR